MSLPSEIYINDSIKQLSGLFRGSRSLLMNSYGNVTHTTKSDNTIVTKLDGQLEAQITDLLVSLDSDVGIVGEEFGAQGNKNIYWLIDPIDGTEQFVRGMIGCVNMACLVADGQAVVSII